MYVPTVFTSTVPVTVAVSPVSTLSVIVTPGSVNVAPWATVIVLAPLSVMMGA